MKLDSAKLKTARLRMGLNQSEVAEGSGVSLTTVSNAEAGKDIYPSTGRHLCNFLGLDLADVVIPVESGNGHGPS